MGVIPDVKIINAQVMHHRLKPKINKFLYSVYYLSLPLDSLNEHKGNWIFGYNRFSIFGIHAKDHGEGDFKLRNWVIGLLDEARVEGGDVDATRLITMPRVLGYAFNPISFWIVPNVDGKMLVVICEVNNTFGEKHIYICTQKNGQIIAPSDVLEAKKIFHVSPFLQRGGGYRFKFSYTEKFFAAFVDYIDDDGAPILLTSVSGKIRQARTAGMLHSFFSYPFMTLKVMFLIHWQALIISLKGIKYVPKPQQLSKKHSITEINL